MNLLNLLAQTNTTTTPSSSPAIGWIAWIVVGAIAGFLGSKIVNKRGEGLGLDILLGLVGSIVGGFLCSLVGIGGGGIIWSIIVATIGAVIVLVVYHKLILGGRTAA